MNLRPRKPKRPIVFDDLVRYNDEVAHGVVHTNDYSNRMAILQAAFFDWQQKTLGKIAGLGPYEEQNKDRNYE